MDKAQCNTPAASFLPFNYSQQGRDWTEGANGTEQSPIDIIPAQGQCSNLNMRMEFFLTDRSLNGLEVKDIGTSLLVNGAFSKLRATDVNGQVYEFEAIQFHFHAPAEHTINGGRYPLELHIVHKMTPESQKNAKTHRDLAVVGIFFELDLNAGATPNGFIDALQLHSVGTPFNMNMHEVLGGELKDMMTYYAYKGSLTTPPCSETANWYVFERPLKITQTQLDYFNQRWMNNMEFAGGHGNFRPTQPLNGRIVMKSTNCCVTKRSSELAVAQMETQEILQTPLLTRDLLFDDLSLTGHFNRSSIESFLDSVALNRAQSTEQSLSDKTPAYIRQSGSFGSKKTADKSHFDTPASYFRQSSSFGSKKESVC